MAKQRTPGLDLAVEDRGHGMRDQRQLTCLLINIRGMVKNAAELTARLRLFTSLPDVVCFNGMWLDRTVCQDVRA